MLKNGLFILEDFINVELQSDDYTDVKQCYIQNVNCNDCEYANACTEYIPF
jgi:hypothetical protein